MGKPRKTCMPLAGDKWSNLLVRYNLTKEAFEALEQSQNYRCRLCGLDKSLNKDGTLVVDHDHQTGRIRGLLCTKCNTALGLFKDNPTTLLKAIQYIKGNL